MPSVNFPGLGVLLSAEEWAHLDSQLATRAEARSRIVKETEVDNFGTVQEFDEGGRQIVYVKTLHGKHDYIGVQEGLQDIIGRKYGLIA